MKFSSLVAASAMASAVFAAPVQDAWNYVEVRPGANIFWWLTGTALSAGSDAPLVLWLQGGPGGSSTGFGQYTEIGKLDVNLNPRNTTWLKAANVLYVDQPVGTGYSYVTDDSLFATNNTQIAADLLAVMKAFLQAQPAFVNTPFFIFCESYGGKMTAGFAQALLAAIDAGEIKINFRGIALGDSWISPIDFVDTWGPFLMANSLMEPSELDVMNTQSVFPCDTAVAAGQWANATSLWGNVEGQVSSYSCADFYNILDVDCGSNSNNQKEVQTGVAKNSQPSSAIRRNRSTRRLTAKELALAPEGVDHDALQQLFANHVAHMLGDPLADLMNGPIRAQLGIIPANVTWGGQSGAVFSALAGDFMRPVVDVVDALLMGGRINVTIYEGSVDLICANVGAERWMTKLTWPGYPDFIQSPKTSMAAFEGAPTGSFWKSYSTLTKVIVLMAGHMVPADNGDMALVMLQTLLNAQS